MYNRYRRRQRVIAKRICVSSAIILGIAVGTFFIPGAKQPAEVTTASTAMPTMEVIEEGILEPTSVETPESTSAPEATPTTDAIEISTKPYYDFIPLSRELQEYTYDICVQYDIREHYDLVLAMMWTESTFRTNLISATNDYGIMQINKCNHNWLSEELGVTDFQDPESSILCGVHMIAGYLHKYDNVHSALMAYNLGEGGAKKKWSQGIYSTSYSRKIVTRSELLAQGIFE